MAHGTVLVVDDDEGIREFLQEALGDEGYEVALAQNGKEALALVTTMTPCVILLDMRMPVMDGWAFALEYRQRARDGVPLVCMTPAADAPQRAREIAAEDSLSKPFDLDDLVAIVARFCPAALVA